MAPLNSIANVLRSMTRKATMLRKRSSKPDIPITDDESPNHVEVDEQSPSTLSHPEAAPDAQLESVLVVRGEVPKSPSKLKYDFQDPTGPPGQLYRGEFKDSKKHGSGAMSFPLDDKEARFMYKGDFTDDKMHGSGVLHWHDGKMYKGQFANNKYHGEGVMTWPDGRKYTGYYVDGRKHGLGTVEYPDGSSYCGQFSKGKMDGEVVYTNTHGIEKLAHFRQGKPIQVSVISEGVPSDATTEASSICSARRSVATSGTVSNGKEGAVLADILAMIDDMQNGEQLGDDDVDVVL